MSSALFYRAGATGIAALTAVALISGCGSSKKSTASASTSTAPAAAASSAAVAAPTPAASSAAAAPASTPTAAASSAAAAVPSNLGGSLAALEASESALVANASVDATKQVVATGGGKFCKDVATSINESESQATAATSTDSTKQEIAQEQALEKKALSEAPNAIKADIVTLFTAENQLDAALAAANYDYSKLDPTALTAMQSSAVLAASQRVTAYLKTTCGIDTGADDSP